MRLIKASTFGFVLLAIFVVSPAANAQTSDRARLLEDIQSMRSQIIEKERAFLAPAPEDQAKYAEFLQQPNSGLCRLLPREKFEGKLLILGAGSNYSFVKLSHDYGHTTEIGYEDGKFNTAFAGADLGLIASLGDVPIDSVDLNHPAADFLAKYRPPELERDAHAESLRINNGIAVGAFLFNQRAAAKIDTTYVMRAITYDDSDVLVALRTIREDSDGSITFLWRVLKQFPKPTLIRTEN